MAPTIEDLLGFIRGLGAAPAFRGAPLADVERLAKLARVPLPPLYREFALALGEHHPGIKLGYDGATSVTQLIRYYEDPDSDAPQAGDLVIGHTGLVSDQLFLDTQGGGIYQGWGGERGSILADSFAQLLWSCAWSGFRFARMQSRVAYVSSWNGCGRRHLLDEASRLACQHGMELAWFSDSQHACLDGDQVCAAIAQRHECGLTVAIGATDPAKRDALARHFVAAFPWLTRARS